MKINIEITNLERVGEDINADAEPVSEQQHDDAVVALQAKVTVLEGRMNESAHWLRMHDEVNSSLLARVIQLESGVSPPKQPTPTTTARGADLNK